MNFNNPIIICLGLTITLTLALWVLNGRDDNILYLLAISLVVTIAGMITYKVKKNQE